MSTKTPHINANAHCECCRGITDADEMRLRNDGKWCCATCCKNPEKTLDVQLDVSVRDESGPSLSDWTENTAQEEA